MSNFFDDFFAPKTVFWKNHYWGGSEIDCFEPIFGFLMQFCFQKHRSGTWDPKVMFSAPSGHSVYNDFGGEEHLSSKTTSNVCAVGKIISPQNSFSQLKIVNSPVWSQLRLFFFCQTGRVIEDATQDFCGATSTQSFVNMGLKYFWSHKFIVGTLVTLKNIYWTICKNLHILFNQVYEN